MYRFHHARLQNDFVSLRMVYLCVTWVTGFLFGLCLAYHAAPANISIAYSVALDRPTVIEALLLLLFPFIFSYLFFSFSKPFAVFILVFFKALCFGCCAYILNYSFGDAGWLMRFLLHFSDSIVVIVLFWFWIRNIDGSRQSLTADFFKCIVISCVIGCVDYFFISPFTLILLNN